jgi:hypothetical protein
MSHADYDSFLYSVKYNVKHHFHNTKTDTKERPGMTGMENEKLRFIQIPTPVGDEYQTRHVQCVFQNEYNEGNKISVHSVWSYSAF